MLLSRFWYVVLSIAVGVSLYVVFLAVGQFNRRNGVVMKEGLASDSQTVEWALKIDARRRLDQLFYASLDDTVVKSLQGSNAQKDGKVPQKLRDDAKKALGGVMDKLKDVAPEFRPDALFAVDRDGHVVGQSGMEQLFPQNDDLDLGGYAVVNDALHGYLRDDTWLLGDKMYLVCARPVETETAPAGAIVALKEFDKRYALDVAKKTRTNLAFYAAGKRVSSATGTEGFEESQLETVIGDLGKLATDKTYEAGRSDVVAVRDDLGAMYTRLPGDAWDQHAGFAVARIKTTVANPMGFISGADDKDKSAVPFLIIIPVLLLAAMIGIFFTFFDHTLPLREMVTQAGKLKVGQLDGLQVARFRGAYRGIAQNVNGGIERIVEKGGGVARRPADLEAILGPVPAQPAMSAFSFPLQDGQAPPHSPSSPSSHSNAGSAPHAPPSVPGRPPPSNPHGMGGMSGAGSGLLSKPTPPVAMNVASQPNAFPVGPAPAAAQGFGARPPGPPPAPAAGFGARPPVPAAAPARPPVPPPAPMPAPMPPGDEQDDDEATMVAQIPAEVLAQATGEHKSSGEANEWLKVYEDFIRTKKQCGEATDGLTFEKFQHTLKKNRDALMLRHGCKRVRFSVYVKEGRASLKATPVKD